jgi:MoxR-like ATPase
MDFGTAEQTVRGEPAIEGQTPGPGQAAARAAELVASCRQEMAKRIVGQKEMVDGLLAALVAGGHILLEGVPGLAKTMAVKTLATITGLEFKRIQFTPDLLPADITGTLVWNQAAGTFSVRRGPVFANVILADEINRAPAKVQSALLEAMEERQVTIGEATYALPDPFLVLATENPIEHEGTYALPEAQLDRFFLKLLVRYPTPDEEIRIVETFASVQQELRPVLGGNALAVLKAASDSVKVDPRITRYLVQVTAATRPPPSVDRDGLYRYVAFGASPRASIALQRCARIRAVFDGRDYVTASDVKAVAYPVLRHRIVLSYEAEADGLDADGVISRILSLIPVP